MREIDGRGMYCDNELVRFKVRYPERGGYSKVEDENWVF